MAGGRRPAGTPIRLGHLKHSPVRRSCGAPKTGSRIHHGGLPPSTPAHPAPPPAELLRYLRVWLPATEAQFLRHTAGQPVGDLSPRDAAHPVAGNPGHPQHRLDWRLRLAAAAHHAGRPPQQPFGALDHHLRGGLFLCLSHLRLDQLQGLGTVQWRARRPADGTGAHHLPGHGAVLRGGRRPQPPGLQGIRHHLADHRSLRRVQRPQLQHAGPVGFQLRNRRQAQLPADGRRLCHLQHHPGSTHPQCLLAVDVHPAGHRCGLRHSITQCCHVLRGVAAGHPVPVQQHDHARHGADRGGLLLCRLQNRHFRHRVRRLPLRVGLHARRAGLLLADPPGNHEQGPDADHQPPLHR